MSTRSAWDPEWVWHHHMGPTNLLLAELLASEMQLQRGMRVLDVVHGWFDALFSVDAYHYFGTSDDYLTSYVCLVKPGGEIGIVVPGDRADTGEWETFRSATWWRRLWERSGVVDVVVADEIPDGRALWLRFLGERRRRRRLERGSSPVDAAQPRRA